MDEKKVAGMRALKFPADLDVIAELAVKAFQYPENEAWSVQADEKEELGDMVSGLRRFWPLIRLIQLVSPAMRDILRGYVWEEDGQPVGLTNYQRRGTTDTWIINTVAVLPSFRRRGIARRLVQASLDAIRARGGKTVWLSVIAGNVPASTLYEQLGFESFASSFDLKYNQDQPPPELAPLDGYSVVPLSSSDWRARLELAQRIVPAGVQRYEPIKEGRYRQSQSMRLLLAIVNKSRGLRQECVAVRGSSNGQLYASAECRVRVRAGGVNHINISADPAHPELAPYLVHHLIRTTQRLGPGRRIELSMAGWQESGIKAAFDVGCVKRQEWHKIGLRFG